MYSFLKYNLMYVLKENNNNFLRNILKKALKKQSLILRHHKMKRNKQERWMKLMLEFLFFNFFSKSYLACVKLWNHCLLRIFFSFSVLFLLLFFYRFIFNWNVFFVKHWSLLGTGNRVIGTVFSKNTNVTHTLII